MKEQFKDTISNQLTTRFELVWEEIVPDRQIASLLDPRCKDIDHEPI